MWSRSVGNVWATQAPSELFHQSLVISREKWTYAIKMWFVANAPCLSQHGRRETGLLLPASQPGTPEQQCARAAAWEKW